MGVFSLIHAQKTAITGTVLDESLNVQAQLSETLAGKYKVVGANMSNLCLTIVSHVAD